MTTKGFGYERAPRVSTSDQADSGPTRTEDHLNLFKHVVESSTDAIGISTPDGLHWYQNAAFDALFGDIGGDPPATLYCDETTGREVFDTIMGGGEWSGEVQMYAADGRVLDILLRAYAFTDASGRVLGLVGVHTDITAGKRSQELFKLVAHATNDVFYEWDVQTDSLQWFSDIAVELGYATGEVPPTIDGWIELIHPEDRPQLADAVEEHRTVTQDIYYLYRVKHKNGTWRFWHDHAVPVLDNRNRPVRWVGGISDITEPKQVEEALAAKAAMERIISKASRRFLTLTELDLSIQECLADIGRFSSADRAYLFQFTPEGTTMNNTHEWCAPGVKPEIDNLQGLPLSMFPWWMDILESGETIRINNVAELPPEAWAEKELLEAQNIKSVLVVPFLLENRLAGFMGFDNVVFERAWGEKELLPLRTLAEIIGTAITRKRAKEALQESEERLRLQIERMPIALILWDRDFRVVTWNPAAESIFGYSSEEAMGRHPYGMIVPEEVQAVVDALWERLLEGDITAHSVNENTTKDGHSIICSWTNTPIRSHDGSIIGALSMVLDITERKRAEEERENLQAKLIQAQKMESIRTLAGGIAHNFNNILMGVQGRTSMIMIGKDPSHPDYEHLKGIEEYIKNAVELTGELLGFARGGKYEVRPTDLNTLILHENRMFGRTKKEIRIHGKYYEELWTVEMDQGQIQQALLNLYVNAWQAMPDGGDLYIQTENVTLDAEYCRPFAITPGRYVKVSVTDTGVGMDAATRKKIFDPFFTTKDLAQGSGLGLASVYGIIKNHGGLIDVTAEKGEGTTFNIYLPASEKPAVKESTRQKRHELQYGKGTILLVDDEGMILEVGQGMLETLGYRVLIADSGQAVLDLYENQKEEIDLVILDMIMPGMGGGETFDRMKTLGGDVPILLSSGYSINGQAKDILDRGCSGFIQKPFFLKMLSRKLHEVLDDGKSNARQ